MDPELMHTARDGLLAWQRGDLSELAELLAPEVELLSWEPGPWDCRGRQRVLSLLGQRLKEGPAPGPVEIFEAGPDQVVVSSTPDPGDTRAGRSSTVITFRSGRVVRMQQYRDLDDALAATVPGTPL
jgi:ketosteroid isomerase-like protein